MQRFLECAWLATPPHNKFWLRQLQWWVTNIFLVWWVRRKKKLNFMSVKGHELRLCLPFLFTSLHKRHNISCTGFGLKALVVELYHMTEKTWDTWRRHYHGRLEMSSLYYIHKIIWSENISTCCKPCLVFILLGFIIKLIYLFNCFCCTNLTATICFDREQGADCSIYKNAWGEWIPLHRAKFSASIAQYPVCIVLISLFY